jgi:hypothetical protein
VETSTRASLAADADGHPVVDPRVGAESHGLVQDDPPARVQQRQPGAAPYLRRQFGADEQPGVDEVEDAPADPHRRRLGDRVLAEPEDGHGQAVKRRLVAGQVGLQRPPERCQAHSGPRRPSQHDATSRQVSLSVISQSQ